MKNLLKNIKEINIDKDKRVGWLRELKPGDNVFVHDCDLRKVKRITPTGRIVVEGTTYSHDGFASSGWRLDKLLEATEERMQDYKDLQRKNFLYKKIYDSLGRLDLETLENMYKCMK